MTMLRGYGREQAYRGGNKVYGFGSSSPHNGQTLDPTGYVNRELNKPRVERRSRLAEAALMRFNSPVMRAGTGDHPKGGNQQPTTSDPKPNQPHGGPKPKPGIPPKDPKPKPGNDPTQPSGPFTPPKVDLNGKLLPMPWEMQMDWINAATSLAQQFSQWDAQGNQANIDLASTLRNLGQQYGINQQQLAGNNASRGMTYSSGNAAQVQNQAAQYGQNTADAQNAVQTLLGQIGVGGSERGLAQSSFDQYQAMLQAEAMRQLALKHPNWAANGPKPNDPNPDGNPSGNPDPRPSKPPKGHGGNNHNPKPKPHNTEPKPPSSGPVGGPKPTNLPHKPKKPRHRKRTR